jgi:hypothetical protein
MAWVTMTASLSALPRVTEKATSSAKAWALAMDSGLGTMMARLSALAMAMKRAPRLERMRERLMALASVLVLVRC